MSRKATRQYKKIRQNEIGGGRNYESARKFEEGNGERCLRNATQRSRPRRDERNARHSKTILR